MKCSGAKILKIFRGTTRFEKKDCTCFSTLIRNVDESYLPTFDI